MKRSHVVLEDHGYPLIWMSEPRPEPWRKAIRELFALLVLAALVIAWSAVQ